MRQLLLVLLPSLTAVTMAVVTAAVVVHGFRRRAVRKRSGLETQARHDVLVVVLGGDQDPAVAAARRRLTGLAGRRGGQSLLTAIIGSVAGTVRGETDDRLADLASVTGVVATLRRELTDPDPARRAAAAETIGGLRLDDGVKSLHVAMRDPDPEVRIAAATAYVRLNPERAAPAVLRMLAKEEPWAAGRLAELVCLIGPTAVPAVLEQMSTAGRSPLLLRVLAAAGDMLAAQPAFVAALASPQADVRIEAARALSRSATTLAVPALLTALNDPEDNVRAHAAAALGQVGAPQVVPALVALLDDPCWSVRQQAAAAIAAVPGGVTVLSDLIDRSPQFVTTAAATGLQHAVAGTGLLADLVADDPLRREEAERAVVALGRRGQYTALLSEAAARYPHPKVRARLAELLAAPRGGPLPAVPLPRLGPVQRVR